jgi:hypothetical protein
MSSSIPFCKWLKSREGDPRAELGMGIESLPDTMPQLWDNQTIPGI